MGYLFAIIYYLAYIKYLWEFARAPKPIPSPRCFARTAAVGFWFFLLGCMWQDYLALGMIGPGGTLLAEEPRAMARLSIGRLLGMYAEDIPLALYRGTVSGMALALMFLAFAGIMGVFQRLKSGQTSSEAPSASQESLWDILFVLFGIGFVFSILLSPLLFFPYYQGPAAMIKTNLGAFLTLSGLFAGFVGPLFAGVGYMEGYRF
ncbi:MAG TPA: hypothetical protein PLP29_14080 [Candidatus Ozemobacteraceae bacterium]|nr:hypothetical protein [Candidatus Ozemobacteraceae bacterium]